MNVACCVVLLLVVATPATAQAPPRAAIPLNLHLSDVDVLLAAQAVLHTADMITTSYDLALSSSAREANPFLAPFAGKPVSLVASSGAINFLQAYTVARLQHRHPKFAGCGGRARSRAWKSGRRSTTSTPPANCNGAAPSAVDEMCPGVRLKQTPGVDWFV